MNKDFLDIAKETIKTTLEKMDREDTTKVSIITIGVFGIIGLVKIGLESVSTE